METQAQAPVTAPVPTEQAVPSTPDAITKELYKVMLDGVESEVDLDELRNGYQASKVSQARFQDSSKMKQEAQAALKLLAENPREVLKQLGLNPRQVAEAMLSTELEELTMDPKDRELRDLRSRFEKQQKDEQEAKSKYEKEQEEAQTTKHLESITNEMLEVLQENGFEPSPYSADRFRYYMQAALDAGHIVRPKDCVEYVVKDIKAEIRAMIGNKDLSKVYDIFGEDLVKKIAKATVQKTKKETVIPRKEQVKGDTLDRIIKSNTPKDFFKKLGRV